MLSYFQALWRVIDIGYKIGVLICAIACAAVGTLWYFLLR